MNKLTYAVSNTSIHPTQKIKAPQNQKQLAKIKRKMKLTNIVGMEMSN